MCFWESRRTTNEGTLTICLPTLQYKDHVKTKIGHGTPDSNAPNMSLPDQNTGMVDALCQSTLKHLSLQTSLQEIFDLKSQHVIETHTRLVQHTDTDETTNESVSFEETFGVFLFEFKQLTSSTTNF